MVKRQTEPIAGRKIHIRLTEDTHKGMRIRVAELDTTIQEWVVSLIERALRGQKKGAR